MNDFLVFAFLFFIGSCFGWGIEVIFRRFFSKKNPQRRWINPGFLTGPYLPLYGFGLWGMYFISCLSSVAMTGVEAVDTVIILVIMMIAMTVIEYIAGLIFIKGMKVKLWDYSENKFNIQGIICPKFSLAWGLLGCFYYFVINPYVIDGVRWLSYHLTFSFVIGMFFGIFIIDVCYSMNISAKIRQFAIEKEIVIRYEELKEYIRIQREEFAGKKKFVLTFGSVSMLKEHMEDYFAETAKKNEERLKEIETKLKTIENEMKSDFRERVENKERKNEKQ